MSLKSGVQQQTAGESNAVASPGGSRRFKISFRASLVVGFCSVLLLAATGIVFNGFYSARKVVKGLSDSILEQTKDLTEQKLEGFFGVVSDINVGTAIRLQNGLLTWQDWDAFRLFLLPVLQRVPQVGAVGAGDGEGNAYNLVRFGDHWRSQEIRRTEWGSESLWKEWTAQGLLVREWREETDFDPRKRPWFDGALDSSEPATDNRVLLPFWTSPYKFYTTAQYGVTVSTRIPWANQLEAVVYFDVALAEMDNFVFESKPSPNGFALILNENLQVLGWPGRGEFARDKVLTGKGEVELAASKLPHLEEILTIWHANGEPDELMDYVQHGGEGVWLNFRTLPGLGTLFHVVIVVPEDDILGEVHKERQRMAVVFAVALAVAVGIAFWFAAIYTQPISALVQGSQAIQRLDLSEQKEISSHIKEVQQLATAQANMSSALESFSRYVPRGVIVELLRQGEAAQIGAHPAELTVLFTDIRRFTAISENLSPDDVAFYLSEYFDALHGTIEQHHGTTDKFIGDAIMAFWGAPKPDEQHASNAVRAVLACRHQLETLNRQWKATGRPEFETTFGLATGPVVVGNVGAATRLNYTVLGNTVNIASRCVGLGRELGCPILALESVAKPTAAEFAWRMVGPVQVRGIRRPMMVCEPLGAIGGVDGARLEFKRKYEDALNAYLTKDFGEALKQLESLVAPHAAERSVHYLIRRCRELQHRDSAELETDHLSFS